MTRRPEDTAFERFRANGAPEALARVFDATASELWRVAWYLSGGDRHRAEDAIQSTFLTAIEDRNRWNPTRPLKPWLLGILGNAVRNDRRRAKRASGSAASLDTLVSEQEPPDDASEAEVRELVARTMQELPQPYREVVILHLEHGLSAQDIANATGRKAGTVRTQVVRGLELLRKALPTGLALGAAFAMPSAAIAAEVLGRVREAVMAHGATVAATLPAAWTIQSTWKSYTMIATLLMIATAVTFGLWPNDALSPAAETVRITPDAETATLRNDDGGARRDVLVEAEEPAAKPESPAPASGSQKIRVRVVDPENRPVPNAPVMFMCDSRLQYAHTDDEGRHEFIELGEPRYYQVGIVGRQSSEFWWPGIMPPPSGGEHVLKLEPGMHLEVTVVDRDGNPVAGATVEGVLGNQWHRMYNVLGRTGADGVLRMRDVDRSGQLRAFASGHQLSSLRNVRGRTGETTKVTLKLRGPAVAVSGVVVDENGGPVPNIDVALVQFGARATKQYTRTDDDGRFRMDWLEPGRHMLIAEHFDGRVSRFAKQRFEHHGGTEPELQLQLQEAARLVGTVRNAEGEPAVQASVYAEGWDEGVYELPLCERSLRTGDNGVFVIDGLLPGPNRLRANIDGSEVRIDRTLKPGDNEWHPQIAAPLPMSARVVDEAGNPLVGWRASMRSLEGFTTGMSMPTNEEGLAPHDHAKWHVPAGELREIAVYAPLPEGVEGLRGDKFDWFPTHVIPPVEASNKPHVVRVPSWKRPNCSIRGTLRNSSGAVVPKSTIRVKADNVPYGFDVVVWADSETGAFEIKPLSPGKYRLRYSVPGERTFAETIRLGKAEHLDLADVNAPTAGKVTVLFQDENGNPTVGSDRLRVTVRTARDSWRAKRQADGTFVATGVHRGDAKVIVWGGPFPSRTHAMVVGEDSRVRATLPSRVTPIDVHVLLPEDQSKYQESWSGTLRIRTAQDDRLILSTTVRHSFRGVFQPKLTFPMPLDPGNYRIEIESWDDRRARVDATVPDKPIELRLPTR